MAFAQPVLYNFSETLAHSGPPRKWWLAVGIYPIATLMLRRRYDGKEGCLLRITTGC